MPGPTHGTDELPFGREEPKLLGAAVGHHESLRSQASNAPDAERVCVTAGILGPE